VLNLNPIPGYTFGAPVWTVPSASAKGMTYTVTVDPTSLLYVCGCKDYTYRRRDCRHIKTVQAGAAGKPRVRVRPVPPVSRPSVAPAITAADLYGDDGETLAAALAAHRAVAS
jgi:hypothetical protein